MIAKGALCFNPLVPFFYLKSEEPQHRRNDWRREAGFSPLSESQVLDLVIENLRTFRKTLRTNRPIVIFDLDSTLYEVGPRTFKIYRTWFEQYGTQMPEGVAKPFAALTQAQVGYSVRDTFKNIGIDDKLEETQKAIEHLHDFWFERFFGDGFLAHDHPYAGAAEYVRAVKREGARIIYLTGRERSKMQTGTIENLKRDGFPMDETTFLLMRENPFFDDVEHKRTAVQKWIGKGTIVATFENEPRNLVELKKMLPSAIHVFVDTICSDYPADVTHGLYRITKFIQSSNT